MTDPRDLLIEMSEAPSDPVAFEEWLSMSRAIEFLRGGAQDEELVVYASGRGTFLHSVLVPADSVNPPDFADLMSWNFGADASWSVDVAFSEPRALSISQPLRHTGSRTIDGGEKIVFARSFAGHPEKRWYSEVLQKFVHLFDLHFVDHRFAYCRLDSRGDIEEIIRICDLPEDGPSRGEAVLVRRAVLDEYAVITKAVVAQMFDFTRYQPGKFSGWQMAHSGEHLGDDQIRYRLHVEPGYASYLRGIRLFPPLLSEPEVLRRYDPMATEEKQYASFITHDWRHDEIREISCAPEATASYFDDSDLPFEISPVFFKPEVLLRYKANRDKYSFSGRSIYCRGSWSLQTFDINDAGQVHTYIRYLGYLPYEEQLYWRSYNEPPKKTISERAFTTDFKGDWYTGYDPLDSLKDALGQLTTGHVPWWSLRSQRSLEQLQYPVTPSADEWADEILHLDQLLGEGFEGKWLRKRAESLGRTPDIKFASIRLLEEVLLGLRFEPPDAAELIAPFREARELRSKVKGHATGTEASDIKRQILKHHRSYQAHFRALCQRCDEAIRALDKALK